MTGRGQEPRPVTGRGEYTLARRLGLLAGAGTFTLLLVLPAPEALAPEAWRTAAVAALMAIWWMTEAIPIPATALLPLVLFPALGVLEMPEATAPYANPLIFLFLGGFLIAFAMERWELHRRIALSIMGAVGTSPERLVLGFMLATAFLSMWISNTATTAMMFPIALAVAAMFRPEGEGGTFHFGVALMLGVAYGASIGGVATIIGTPPNAILVGAADELLGVRIGFLEWMTVGIPLAALFIPIAWLLLVKVLHPPGALLGDAARVLESARVGLGSMGRGEKVVGTVFALTATAWIMRAPKEIGEVTIPGIETFLPFVDDATIAMAGAIALFLIPVDWRKGDFALDWQTARRLPWGVLILFGGGLSLARAMDQSGLAAWIGAAVGAFEALPLILLVAVAATLFVFLTELTSNTATATMAMPIMAGAAVGLGIPPLALMATVALSSSMAFMLPVATPPNAIVFASPDLTIPRMARAGIWMNLISITLVSLLGAYLVVRFLT